MSSDRKAIKVEVEEVELLSRLVDAEIERRCEAIDAIIQHEYDVVPAKHTPEAIAAVKSAILVLVHSDLAALERKLACVEVEPEEEPEPMHEPEEEVAPAEEPKPEPKPVKSKA
jgi:hypothetical protein